VDISSGNEHIFAYTRTSGDESGCESESESALVVLNFREEKVEFELGGGGDWGAFRFVFGNYGHPGLEIEGNSVWLRGYEGRLYVKENLVQH
jgi:hypothetical protein